jgi:hypothetical protein
MINFYRNNPTNTFAVYPDYTSSYSNRPDVRYTFTLDQDYDRSLTTFTGSLINTPTRVNPRLVFQVTGSAIPEWSGLYTFTLQESLKVSYKWGQAHFIWNDYHVRWSELNNDISQSLIDSDRAKVSGSDAINFQSYTTSSTEYIYDSGSTPPDNIQYTGSVQTGAYITYH